MGMILRIASSRIVGQGDIVGRSGYFSLNLSANSVMRGRLDARRTLKSLVADLRNNKRVVVNRFFTHVQDDKLYNDIIKQIRKYPISYHPPESLPAYKWHPDSKGRHHWY